MQLDPPSILITLLATHVVYTLLLLGMWVQRRTHDALALWALANALGVASFWCFSQRAVLPYSVTVSLANAGIIGAWMAIWAGMRRFSQRRIPLAPTIGAPLLVGALLQFVPALHDHYPARCAVVGVPWVAGILLTVAECARAERSERLYMRRVLMAAFVLLAGFITVRALLTLQVPTPEDRLLTGRLAGLNFFINMLIGTVWNLGLVMMCNEQLEKRLRRNANRDGLTDMLNRRGFQEMSQRVLHRARRDGTPVSLLLMDLDNFKKINDQHGHDAGDRMLCLFAAVAERVLRPTDVIARHGGEEFCALLSRTSQPEACAAAERLRQDFSSATIFSNARTVGTTVSIGAIEIGPDESIEQALLRADAALYQAKLKGRNRVEVPMETPAYAWGT